MTVAPRGRLFDRTTPPHALTLVMLSGIAALAMNVFLPSLPGMSAYFDTDYGVMQLSVALYLGVNAALQLVIGPLSDRFGRRSVILWSLVIFCLASLGCIFSTNVTLFLVFRMIQATVAAAIVLSRAVIRDMLPEEQAASMIGYVTMGMAVVPMIAPAIGGYLEANFGWQASFWLLFACGAAVLALSWYDLGETAQKSGLSLAQQFAEYPELLTAPRFWGYSLSAALSSGVFFAYLGGGPFVGSSIYGLEPERLGLFFGLPALGYLVGNFLSGKYAARVGIKPMVLAGNLSCALGVGLSLLTALIGIGSAYSFFGFMIIVGLGNGLTLPSANSGMMSVRPHLAGTASGLGGAIMLGGGAALGALAGALLTIETGPFPLLWIMMASALAAAVCILLVIRRDRRLEGQS